MQYTPHAVITEYKGPTNTRCARIYAKSVCGNLKAWIIYNHEKSPAANHASAAQLVLNQEGLDSTAIESARYTSFKSGYFFTI